jgi:hypothetical protein
MDLLKLIRSFEELLFEVLSWLVYYPRTLWLVLRHPLRTMAYANHEEPKDGTDRYPDTLSPPLTLLLTVALSHGAELALGVTPPAATGDVERMVLDNDQNFIVLRSLVYGMLPLMAAVQVARARHLPPERRYLRPPFLAQCYLTAVLAGAMTAASLTGRLGLPMAQGIAAFAALTALLWYAVIQVRLFEATLGLTRPRAIVLALKAFGGAVAYALGLALILSQLN